MATVEKALKRVRTNLRRRLTPDEKRAVDTYANLVVPRAGFVMNMILRGAPLNGVDEPTVRAAKECIPHLDAVMAKARFFPTEDIGVVYRGVAQGEVEGWKVGDTRTSKGFVSTSFLPARAFLYQGCCIVVIDASGGEGRTKFVYSPNEEELILDRGTRLRLESVRTVKATTALFKHPKYPVSDLRPLGADLRVYDAVLV